MSTPLRIAKTDTLIQAPVSAAPSVAERVQQLQAEARRVARDHVELLRANLMQTRQLAGEIAAGGDAYPVGIREVARRLAEESGAEAQTLQAILERCG